MDEVHIGMGSVLNILHTYGVWVLEDCREIFLLDIALACLGTLSTRIIKLIAIELYCTHTAACIFYYLATTLPAEQEGYTWIGSLKLGDCSYLHFRQIDLWKRYTISLYFAIVTMSTVDSRSRESY
ncbi:Potassium channel SKOR [Camellia lanceoleosa]|uniref:Potassium channel SKOR n=1 Tax=Camellia lanceoleosa TaxID=1840588 RepID=A0ACC0GJM5_9ERIC|nr:Potassium channel SKOR [Camellia lanceoleosa]